MIKVANNIQRMLEKQSMDMDPTYSYGLGGALAGAGLGAGGGALYELLKGEKEKNYLKSILMGAGLGGVGGGLLGAGYGHNRKEKARDEAAGKLQGIREQESREKTVAKKRTPVPGAIQRNPPSKLLEALEEMGIDPNKKTNPAED